MPKTNYRFRVIAIFDNDGIETKGEWSEPESIQTTDNQSIDLNSLSNHAVVMPIQKSTSQILGVITST